MPKVSNLYLDIDPFKIIETTFHKDRAQVSESIFSLANEYSGIRGFYKLLQKKQGSVDNFMAGASKIGGIKKEWENKKITI